MMIDAHIHMWHRDMLPDRAVKSYLEPLKKFKDMYGGVLDMGLDEEVPFSDYSDRIGETIRMMDSIDIDYAVVLGTDFEMVNEHRMTNDEYMDWLFERCSIDRRFIPFISVDPNKGEEALRSIERLVKKYAPKGIKMYPATGFNPDDPKFDDYWDLVDDLDLVVTTHAGIAMPPLDERFCHPRMFARVAERHPDMKIIVAHLGGKFHEEIFPLMEEHDNVYTDCSSLQGWIPEDRSMVWKRLDSVTSRFPDRVVFGTDFPLYEFVSAEQFIRLIRDGDWGSERIKDGLFGRNMGRVLGI